MDEVEAWKGWGCGTNDVESSVSSLEMEKLELGLGDVLSWETEKLELRLRNVLSGRKRDQSRGLGMC